MEVTCPKCNAPELYAGFGLAGGGYGSYVICDACGYFDKQYVEDEQTETEKAVRALCIGLSRLVVPMDRSA